MMSPENNVGADIPPFAEVTSMREHCGLWATWDPGNTDMVMDALIGLHGIEHRGEDGAGLVVAAPSGMPGVYVPGRASNMLLERTEELGDLPSDMYAATGHTRYSTHPSDQRQPIRRPGSAFSHNGMLTNADQVAEQFGIDGYTTDSDVAHAAIHKTATLLFGGDIERATLHVLPYLQGAFNFTILTANKLIAVKDRNGIRPLQLGRTKTGGYIVTSESKSIHDTPGATEEREIGAGEMVVISNDGLRSIQWAKADEKTCVFESLYLSNKENKVHGQRAEAIRRALGALQARGVERGIVVPLPNSGNQVAHGLSEASGLELVRAFTKNPDFGRAFLQPTEADREWVAEHKLLLDEDMVVGEDVILTDDTLVRGPTARANVRKLFKAGAKSVHLYIGAPMYVKPCRLGVDTGNDKELLAVRKNGNIEAMREWIGATSLTFLSLENIREVVGTNICDYCIGGEEPDLAPIPEDAPLALPHHRKLSLSLA